MARWIWVGLSLALGAGFVIKGTVMVTTDVPASADSWGQSGYERLGHQIVGWPLILVGATIVVVVAAYHVSHPRTAPSRWPQPGDDAPPAADALALPAPEAEPDQPAGLPTATARALRRES